MHESETLVTLKARKLAELRDDVARAANENDQDLRIWRQGLIHGRLLELQAFGVLTLQESDAFAEEMQLALEEQPIAANDPYLPPNDPA